MESFVIQWPEEENWNISQSRVEGNGRTIVFELTKKDKQRSSEKVWQFVQLGNGESPDGKLFTSWREDIEQKTSSKLSFHDSDNLPGELFSMSLEENGKDSFILGYFVEGSEIALLMLHTLDRKHSQEDSMWWKRILYSLRFVEQPLWYSLNESGLLPPQLEQQIETTPVNRPELPPQAKAWAHPSHPYDFPYLKLNDKGTWEGPNWVRILKKVRSSIYIGMLPDQPEQTAFYVRWDNASNLWIHISSQGLLLLDKKHGISCQYCGFASFDPFLSKSDNTPERVIYCPNCNNALIISG